MRFQALATDYDGTLATHGTVDKPTVSGLERLRSSGRKLLMVTGRELPDLKKVFPAYPIFDLIVAENGALLHHPATEQEQVLCEPADSELVRRLRDLKVPISVGRAIIATVEPHDHVVLETIHQLGLEQHVIYNKGSVMVLPSGVNKATGLQRALEQLRISPAATVGIGDAENDHAFLAACGCSVAVANALLSLKSRAQVVTRGTHGAGVLEIIDELLANDLVVCRASGGDGAC
jgi:hypothetical protein